MIAVAGYKKSTDVATTASAAVARTSSWEADGE